jgi:hypothetical protein
VLNAVNEVCVVTARPVLELSDHLRLLVDFGRELVLRELSLAALVGDSGRANVRVSLELICVAAT